MDKLKELKERRKMLYSELMEILKPYADKNVWFNVEERKDCAEVTFYLGDVYITFKREWARKRLKSQSVKSYKTNPNSL